MRPRKGTKTVRVSYHKSFLTTIYKDETPEGDENTNNFPFSKLPLILFIKMRPRKGTKTLVVFNVTHHVVTFIKMRPRKGTKRTTDTII